MIFKLPINKTDKIILDRFRTTLIKYNYTYDYFQQIDIKPFTFTQFDLPLLAYRFPATTPFGILFHLFLLGGKVHGKIVRQIFDDDFARKLFQSYVIWHEQRLELSEYVLGDGEGGGAL